MNAQAGDERKPLLVFLNEVAGGRKLLQAVRERQEMVSGVVVAAPQNQPSVGQLIDTSEVREAARARVEVTMAVLAEFGIESFGEVMDPEPSLALDDAVRAHRPGEVLLSCLADTRFGFMRRDLVEWAREKVEPEVKLTHIPVRIDDDAIRWDLNHTLVVATKTVAAPDLVTRLKERASIRPHRFTIVCPRADDVSEGQVVRDLAATLAELYRNEIDATGQPMSPDPFYAVKNAIEHYRIDDILISTLRGEQSVWLQEGLIEKVQSITDKPVEHVEASTERATPSRPPAAVGAGEGG